jgi:hypothetical protein
MNLVYSRIARWVYAVVAAVNLACFWFYPFDLNYIAIALLMVVLIYAQKGVDAWRESAQAWRETAAEWQKSATSWRALAERWRSEKWN